MATKGAILTRHDVDRTNKYEWEVDGFAGMDNSSDPSSLADNISPDILNSVYDLTGAVETRTAYTKLLTTSFPGAIVNEAAYYKSDGTSKFVVFAGNATSASTAPGGVAGTYLCKYDNAGGYAIIGGPYTVNTYWDFTVINNKLYAANGTDGVYSWTGSGNFVLSTNAITPQYIENKKNRLYGLKGSLLYFTDAGNPDSWPTNNYIQINTDDNQIGTGLKKYFDDLVIYKTQSVWYLQGEPLGAGTNTTVGNLQLRQADSDVGCPSILTVKKVRRGVLMWACEAGIAVMQNYHVDIISQSVDATFKNGMNTNLLAKMWAIYSPPEKKYILGYPSSTSSTPDKAILVDMSDTTKIKFALWDHYPGSCAILFRFTVRDSVLIGHPTKGYIVQAFQGYADIAGDNGTTTGVSTVAAGTNLVTNPSFETGTTGWSNVGYGTNSQMARQSSFGFSGSALANSALNFSGSGQYVSTADNGGLRMGAGGYFWSFWIKTTATLSEDLIVKANPSSPFQYYVVRVNAGQLYAQAYDGTTDSHAFSNALINDGNWHHVAVNFNNDTNKTLQMWIDGVVDTLSGGGTFVNHGTTDSTASLFIGKGVLSGHDFAGSMYGLVGGARTLSQADVTNFFNHKTHRYFLGVDWPMNEGTGTTLTDNSGNAITGTITGATWTTGNSTAVSSLRVSNATNTSSGFAGGVSYTATGLTIGQTYTMSGYIYSVFGGESLQLYADTTVPTTTGVTLTAGWVRYSQSFIATATSHGLYFRSSTISSTTSGTWYLDAVQLETGSSLSGYIDGSLGSGYSWTGTANASTSTRSFLAILSDSTKTWTTNQFADADVTIVSGTGAGQQMNIASNTANQLIFSSAWAISPDTSSVYSIGAYTSLADTSIEDFGKSAYDKKVKYYNIFSDSKANANLQFGYAIAYQELAFTDLKPLNGGGLIWEGTNSVDKWGAVGKKWGTKKQLFLQYEVGDVDKVFQARFGNNISLKPWRVSKYTVTFKFKKVRPDVI